MADHDQPYAISYLLTQASSSIGRAPLSKSGGCGFNSCLACLFLWGQLSWLLLQNKFEGDRSVAKSSVMSDNAIVRYLRETRAELSKVSWPTPVEARNLTIV